MTPRPTIPVAIAVGAVVGVLARWQFFDNFTDLDEARTVIVNAAGCLLMGLFVGRGWREELRQAATVGFCGGLTTFSTFALDAAVYIDAGEWADGAIYVGVTALASASAYAFGRRVFLDPL